MNLLNPSSSSNRSKINAVRNYTLTGIVSVTNKSHTILRRYITRLLLILSRKEIEKMSLVRLRKKRKLTQEELAKKVGVSRSLIARIESNWERPYPSLKKRIAEALDVEEQKIFK